MLGSAKRLKALKILCTISNQQIPGRHTNRLHSKPVHNAIPQTSEHVKVQSVGTVFPIWLKSLDGSSPFYIKTDTHPAINITAEYVQWHIALEWDLVFTFMKDRLKESNFEEKCEIKEMKIYVVNETKYIKIIM